MIFSRGYADAVAWKKGEVYAFEIKQKGDYIAKGLRQLSDYSEGANYCILVVDEIGKRQIKKFQNKGYGVWKRVGDNFIELHAPYPTEPIPSKLEWSLSKFRRYYKKKMTLALSNTYQKTLGAFQ